MRFLILSDIHSNLPALEAVIKDAAGKYDQILCLGDVVGYCADPNPVAEWIRANASATVRGNHDRACVGDSVIEWFTGPAQFSALWTYATLKEENRLWLEQLPQGPVGVANFFLAHGSPRDEDEYITTKNDAMHLYQQMPGEICFIGHTHVQGGFGLRRGRSWLVQHPKPKEPVRVHQLETDSFYLLNPGSVGQPRDGDPRAAYAIYEPASKVIAYHRVAYDIAKAQRRIRDENLPFFLADRLNAGR